MAQLKDTVIQGSARVTDTLYSTTVQTTTLQALKILAPTASNGTTYGPGSNNQILFSNGTSIYWGNFSHTHSYLSSLTWDTTNKTLKQSVNGGTASNVLKFSLANNNITLTAATNELKIGLANEIVVDSITPTKIYAHYKTEGYDITDDLVSGPDDFETIQNTNAVSPWILGVEPEWEDSHVVAGSKLSWFGLYKYWYDATDNAQNWYISQGYIRPTAVSLLISSVNFPPEDPSESQQPR